jgi:hypothetical protein
MLTLRPDSEMRVLVVQRSKVGLYAGDDFESMVCHYDFDRAPGNQYPLAHFQVWGESDTLKTVCDRTGVGKPLRDLHFPVDGKRYRPTVDDMIEFLAIEGLVPTRAGWEDVVVRHRARWDRLQLRSVVRRDPEIAAEERRRQGYVVEPRSNLLDKPRIAPAPAAPRPPPLPGGDVGGAGVRDR